MLKIIQYIKHFFKKNDKPIEETDKTNAITILLENTDPYIHISIMNTDKDSVINLAKVLYQLNTGQYATHMMNILLELSKEDAHIALFVSQVMTDWVYQIEAQRTINEPYVKPTAFGNNK
jgi:hypothetical protein